MTKSLFGRDDGTKLLKTVHFGLICIILKILFFQCFFNSVCLYRAGTPLNSNQRDCVEIFLQNIYIYIEVYISRHPQPGVPASACLAQFVVQGSPPPCGLGGECR